MDGVIGNTGLFEKFNVLHLTGVVRLQGLQGYKAITLIGVQSYNPRVTGVMGVGLQGLQGNNSRVITQELLGLSRQSYLGLLTRSYRGYRGYNSRVITPGITMDAGMLQCTQSGNTGEGLLGLWMWEYRCYKVCALKHSHQSNMYNLYSCIPSNTWSYNPGVITPITPITPCQ